MNLNTEDKEKELREQTGEDNAAQEETTPTAEETPEKNADLKEEDVPAEEDESQETKLEKAEAEVAELNDRYLRLSAEFDNYRRRTLKEKTELIMNGGEKVLTSILPILDDLERAMQNMETAADVEAIKEGVNLIYTKFLQTLEHNGVKVIETEGQALNTDYHEAIALIEAPEEEQKGKILDCVQKGYTLNDKVIRHAKVVIGK